jgi:hypothetical protein
VARSVLEFGYGVAYRESCRCLVRFRAPLHIPGQVQLLSTRCFDNSLVRYTTVLVAFYAWSPALGRGQIQASTFRVQYSPALCTVTTVRQKLLYGTVVYNVVHSLYFK